MNEKESNFMNVNEAKTLTICFSNGKVLADLHAVKTERRGNIFSILLEDGKKVHVNTYSVDYIAVLE